MYSIGPDHHAGLGKAVAALRARQAKIHHHDAALLVAHDVAGLQVAVDHAFGMCCLQARKNLLGS